MHADRYVGSTFLDPGTRTFGELIQEREWAAGEIRRLRIDINRLSQKKEAERIEREICEQGASAGQLDPALNAQRLLRLKEVSTMIGLYRSAIYRYVRREDSRRRSRWVFEA